MTDRTGAPRITRQPPELTADADPAGPWPAGTVPHPAAVTPAKTIAAAAKTAARRKTHCFTNLRRTGTAAGSHGQQPL